MSKPNMRNFNKFARITLAKYERYLPTAFDESLTLLEKINKLIEYLNAMGVLVNDVVEQWNEVMEWIINDGINDTVLDRLDEMVDDGTLATIINEHIFEELNNKVDQKADKVYVDGELNKKADSDYVDGELDKKADNDYVVDELNRKASTSTENTDIHVSPRGNNQNAGTYTEPVRTIAKAVEMLPDLIGKGHTYRIILDVGEFNEDVALENITVQGELQLIGSTTIRENHKINRLNAENIFGFLRVENITATSQTGALFRFMRCAPNVAVGNVATEPYPDIDLSESDNTRGLLADAGSHVSVYRSHFENRRYGIRCNRLSRVHSENNTGNRNYRGIGARWGGIITTYGSTPTATAFSRNRSTDSGGLIIDGDGVSMGLPRGDLYLVDRVANRTDGTFYKKLYNVNQINGAHPPVLAGQQIKLTFKGINYGPVRLNIKYSGSRPPATNSQHIECVWTGTLTAPNFRSPEMTVLYNHDFATNRVEVVHMGSGLEFQVIVSPIAAESRHWSVEVECQSMRNYAAPNLIGVVVE